MKHLLLITSIFFLSIGPAIAVTDDMQLRGEGEARYMGLIKVYDAQLYIQAGVAQKDILADDSSRCLQLTYAVSLKPDDFVRGALHVIEKQYRLESLPVETRNGIDTLHSHYQPVQKGDRYSLCYNAATTVTSLDLNGRNLVQIKSPDFARVYFGIWLGNGDVLDESLRDDLLADDTRRGG